MSRRMAATPPPTPDRSVKKKGCRSPKATAASRLEETRHVRRAALPGIHFRDAALINAKVRRNIVLELAVSETLTDDAVGLFVERGALTPGVVMLHGVIFPCRDGA